MTDIPVVEKRVDFYQLVDDAPLARERYAGRLAEKARRNGYTLLVLAADDGHAAQVDESLWSFAPESFLPHGRAVVDDICVATRIGDGAHAMLLNLGTGIPSGHERFTRIAEIVPANPAARDQARSTYRGYQQQGFSVHYHDLGKPRPKGS